ncbi:LptF/LptG family permease [Phenylobacterium deserti]|uniref:Permease n=1 Tax=Phenylobacterium deserti TaxID=1914756 RepID=A0A328ADF3_9CAUL|nr:LptF/LptG family permease [Phenylobacterium deserti]RAK52792.1 permease [Phenylobacterium deserti]
MIIQRHVTKILATRVLAALVILVSILQILDLLDATTDILERKLGAGGVVYYALLRTPTLIQQVAPLAMLAGALFAFTQMARENAVVALRSTGMSVYRLVTIALPVALGVAALHLACAQWLSPRADAALDAWWARGAPEAEDKAPEPRSFRVGTDVVVATPGDTAGRRLVDLSLYRRDGQGRLVERVRAPAAAWQGGGWRLERPAIETVGPNGVQQASAAQMDWTQGPRPADVRALFGDPQDLAPASAARALAGGAAVRPPSFYEAALQRGWAAPLGAVVMLLLAAPVLLVNFRSGGGRTVVGCLAAGLLFMVVDGVFTAMAQSGVLPAALGAWSGAAIFAFAAAGALVHLEG